MYCKWCNNILNGANEYQLAGYCNANCRMWGGGTDKINLPDETDNPRIEMPSPPIPEVPKTAKKKREKPVVVDQAPSLEDFFKKKVLK